MAVREAAAVDPGLDGEGRQLVRVLLLREIMLQVGAGAVQRAVPQFEFWVVVCWNPCAPAGLVLLMLSRRVGPWELHSACVYAHMLLNVRAD